MKFDELRDTDYWVIELDLRSQAILDTRIVCWIFNSPCLREEALLHHHHTEPLRSQQTTARLTPRPACLASGVRQRGGGSSGH